MCKRHYNYRSFFNNLCQTKALKMNLSEKKRDFNKNSRQVQKNGFETHTKTEKEERLPLRNETGNT